MNVSDLLAIVGGLLGRPRVDEDHPSGDVAPAENDALTTSEIEAADFFPTAETEYEYAFAFARFVGPTESSDVALDIVESFDGAGDERSEGASVAGAAAEPRPKA
jgi:hypothetical protein